MHFAFSRNFCFIKYTSESGAGYFLPSSTFSAQAYVATQCMFKQNLPLGDLKYYRI